MKKVFALIIMLFINSILFISCEKDGEDTLVPAELKEAIPIEESIPAPLLADLEQRMTIYKGNTPPKIDGCYLISKEILISSTIDNDIIGKYYIDKYIKFSNQTNKNIITYEELQSNAVGYSNLVSISGNGNYFTAYFISESTNKVDNYTAKTSTVISGELTDKGIKNCVYAFLMLEKNDPNDIVVPINTIRVFKDDDGLAQNAVWPGTSSRVINGSSYNDIYLKCNTNNQ